MSDEPVPEPKIAVSIEMKLNLGNYESCGGSIMLSGLKAGSTEEEIEALLETGELSFFFIKRKLQRELAAFKAERQRKNGAPVT